MGETNGTGSRREPGDGATAPLEEALSAVREALEMDVAFVSEFVGDRQVFRALEGDVGSFGVREGDSLPLEGSICKRLIEGSVPNAIPDARNDERVRDLDITRAADLGSYVGFPLWLSDGSLYGTLCCASHSPDPWLRERDLLLMRDVARRATEQLERKGVL